MAKLRHGTVYILVAGGIFIITGGYLWANTLDQATLNERIMYEYQTALTRYEKENVYYTPKDIVHYVRDRKNPSGYFVSNPDLIFEPSELNKNTMKATRFSVVTLDELDSTEVINSVATADYIMGNYVEDERGHAGFRTIPGASPGVRTTLDAIMVLEKLDALDDPRLDLEKVEAFILAHQNPDGGFWDEDYPADGASSTLKCTSFALRGLGRINQHLGKEFRPDFKDRVAGFVESCFDETDGGYANKPGAESTETYGTFRAFISLWWIGGNSDDERRAFVKDHMDLKKTMGYLFDNHYYPETGAFSRYEDKSRGDESLKATHLVVWFLDRMDQEARLERLRLIRYTIDQEVNPGQYGSDIYSTYAAVLMLRRLDAPTETYLPPEKLPTAAGGYPWFLPPLLMVFGIMSFGASGFVERRARELEESEEMFRNLAEKSPNMIFINKKGRVVYANQRCEVIMGYTVEEFYSPDFDFLSFIAEGDRKKVKSFFDKHLEGEEVEPYEYGLITKDGRRIDVITTTKLIQYEGEQAILGIITDITRRKEMERVLLNARDELEHKVEERTVELKASLDEKDVLLKEVHHRVKNNMQAISSLLQLHTRYVKDEKDLEVFKDGQNRIRAMGQVHEKLYHSGDLARIDFNDYVGELAHNLFHFYGIDPDNINLKITVSDVLLGIDTAVPCGLIINELISNSLKYAFPDGRRGEIEISLFPIENGTELVVSDDGVGIREEVDFKNTATLGLQLVNTLVKQLRGDIQLDRTEGTKFSIRFEGKK